MALRGAWVLALVATQLLTGCTVETLTYEGATPGTHSTGIECQSSPLHVRLLLKGAEGNLTVHLTSDHGADASRTLPVRGTEFSTFEWATEDWGDQWSVTLTRSDPFRGSYELQLKCLEDV